MHERDAAISEAIAKAGSAAGHDVAWRISATTCRREDGSKCSGHPAGWNQIAIAREPYKPEAPPKVNGRRPAGNAIQRRGVIPVQLAGPPQRRPRRRRRSWSTA